MSQAQLNATQVLCRVLEQDNAQIDGRGLHMNASEGARHLLREKLLIHTQPSSWVTCPECGVHLARIEHESVDHKVRLYCPDCLEITGPKFLVENYKVSFSRLIASLVNGLGLSLASPRMVDGDRLWRLGKVEFKRGQCKTWYFARQLDQPEVARKLREQIKADMTTKSCVILSSADVPLPAYSPLDGFDVRYLGLAARISQSRFDFHDHDEAPQILDEVTPGTTLRYVRTQAKVFIEGREYALEPRQRLILLALLDDLDHELDRETLKLKSGSQSQSFTPSKEFQRNKLVYETFVRYHVGDQRYSLVVPEGDLN
ncbi:MAG: hypothetical protein ACOYB2_18925 [Limnohabitans sp.]